MSFSKTTGTPVGVRIRSLRERLGLSQSDLAAHAGVSRQLVGALEAGRHLPRVDAGIAIAAALGVDVATLFGIADTPVHVLTGEQVASGTLVRAGRVGDRSVVAPLRSGESGWDVADGVVDGGELRLFGRRRPGPVVAGCEPGLEALERILRESDVGAVAVSASTTDALASLVAGRVHAAVVHGGPTPLDGVVRFRLCRWRVGLSVPADDSGLADRALAGEVPVVQREAGAAVQRAFEAVAGSVEGPRAAGHLAAARMTVATGLAAVTIEPVAIALGLGFRHLETHDVELWTTSDAVALPEVAALLGEINGRRFWELLAGVGGYDLEGCGSAA